ncbi:6-carboxyhexanoate--CoA ligase [Zhengella mangrovi]|uniref:6-carboxyhexanoate--CoA ligase n=1 Tax=Zhengella mangrovi TaxID=1982044 RepID=A0A2G1QIH4_9HYPH|nr:acetate--CoA ligase [Zhengella mangrovi]PHP65254.1 6-carboxyhexanoate--CoA ligase [Zhengella mangrovi]
MAAAVSERPGLDALFQPRSIAVVGASSDPTKTGGRPVNLLKKHGYGGAIYPVNPSAPSIQGLPAFASVEALPVTPDLVLVAVPGAGALAALESAAARGVRAAVVLSAGFAESGADGAELQKKVTALAQDTGMRIVGPNCLGSISVRERAIGTFTVALENEMPAEGGVSIVSQSGNVGSSALRQLGDSGAGVARFIATGNEADVQAADAIEWLADDSDTRVILCCLETCRDGPRLTRALERARQAGKPVVILKIGTSEVGQKAALSHTGGLAGSDRVFDAVFARHGAIRVHSLEQLVEIGAAIEAIGGRRISGSPSVALIAASGGFGVMMADAASANGIAVNPLGATAQASIKAAIPLASAMNPIDATAQMSANPDIMEKLLDATVLDDANNVICLMLALGMEIPRLRNVFTAAFARIIERYPEKLLVACIPGPADAIAQLRAMGIACFPSIDSAMAGIAAIARLQGADSAGKAPEPVVPEPIDPGVFRNEATAKAALGAAGVPFVEDILAATADEAAAAADRLGVPVAMKILSPDIQHKSDIGGVELNVQGGAAARAAFERVVAAAGQHAPDAAIDGVLVSPMTSGGVELILGVTTDAFFGPAIMVGLGGIFAEIFKDTSLRMAPVTPAEARAMVRELKAFPLLDGARGRPVADLDALGDAISALSQFAARHAADVAEIDINPLLVRPKGQGVVALDALIVPKHAQDREAES